MIRVWLLVALVACSKTPRTSHEETPRPHDAQALVAPADAMLVDATVVDATVVDAATVDAAARPDAAVKPRPKLGKLGDICAKGSRAMNLDEGPMSRPVVTCGPGLICCYPCGIQGCDSVCKKTCPAVP